jgi:tetratricopeptide (TPR) repeat protein
MQRAVQLLALSAAMLVAPVFSAPVLPANAHTVVERLPARLTSLRKPGAAGAALSAAQAAAQARQLIEQSRGQGDPRLLGHAQTLLAPWWNKADAPVDIAVLQATILQSQHNFAAARELLNRLVASAPENTQAWLTLATVERVTGNLNASDAACTALTRTGARWAAGACAAENQSLRGGFAFARKAFAALAGTPGISAAQQAWVLSLAAENEERAGDDAAAAQLYRTALRAAPDRYTALAYADLLLRTGQHALVAAALAQEPATDAVLIRRATAAKRMQDAAWRSIADELIQRRTQLLLRDDSAAHAREMALIALWIEDDAAQAWREARRNYTLQREAFDGWLLMQAALATGTQQHIKTARALLQSTGIVDARITRARAA